MKIKNLSKTKESGYIVEFTKEEWETIQFNNYKTLAEKLPENIRSNQEELKKHLDIRKWTDMSINDAVQQGVKFLDSEKMKKPEGFDYAVDIEKFSPTELEIKFEFEKKPVINVENWKDIKIEPAPKVRVVENDIKNVLSKWADVYPDYTPVDEAAKVGHTVEIDFVGKLDGSAFPGGSSKNYKLKLGSQTFIPGFEEALIATKAKQLKDIPLSFPKDYHDENLKGQDVVFEVKVHNVLASKPSEINDELVKKIGWKDVNNLEEANEYIRKGLTSEANERNLQAQYDSLARQLIQISKVEVNPKLLNAEVEQFKNGIQEQAKRNKTTMREELARIGLKNDNLSENELIISFSTDRIKLSLIINHFKELFDIKVSQKEIDDEKSKMNPNANPELSNDMVINFKLISKKVFDRILKDLSK